MYEKLIQSYVNKITIDDITNFSKTYGIILDENETKIIYDIVKNEWHTVIYGNPRPILDRIKEKFNFENYQKIEQLYLKFKEKYQNYL